MVRKEPWILNDVPVKTKTKGKDKLTKQCHITRVSVKYDVPNLTPGRLLVLCDPIRKLMQSYMIERSDVDYLVELTDLFCWSHESDRDFLQTIQRVVSIKNRVTVKEPPPECDLFFCWHLCLCVLLSVVFLWLCHQQLYIQYQYATNQRGKVGLNILAHLWKESDEDFCVFLYFYWKASRSFSFAKE